MKYHYYCTKNSEQKLGAFALKSFLKTHKLNCVNYKEAIIVTGESEIDGCVFDLKGSPISQSLMCENNSVLHFPTQDNIKFCSDTVIFIGILYNVYGHIITDGLKKLWFILSEEGRKLLQKEGVKIAYIAKWSYIPNYVRQIYELLGIDIKEAINVRCPTKFHEVFLPDNSFVQSKNDLRYYTNDFLYTISKLKNHVKGKTDLCFEKVYFSRAKNNSNRREYGEIKLQILFEKIGYKIICPEDYSFIEQLQILNNCKSFASTEGSVSHNALFLNNGAELILLRKANYVNSYQLAINQMIGASVYYIDVNFSFLAPYKEPYKGPFYLYITDNVSLFFRSKFSFSVNCDNRLLDSSFYKYMWNAVPIGEHWHRPSILWYLLWTCDFQKRIRQIVRKWLKM